MRKYFIFLSLALTALTSICVAQPPPAASSGGKPKVTKTAFDQSLKDLAADDHFSSIDGRFTLALPKMISSFAALTPANMGTNAAGGQFHWRVKEGAIVASYYDFLDPNFHVKTDQDYVNYFAGARDAILKGLKAKLLSEKPIRLGDHRGEKLSFELANGTKGMARIFYVDRRNYTFIGVASASAVEADTILSNALDTFTLISQSKLDADKLKSIETSTPAALPQEPVTIKERTDAEDEGLKGRVKTVTIEDQDLSGTWSVQTRHFSSIRDYNEKGNYLKRISFDSFGNAFEITVYGYLNGARVSKYSSIRYEYDPPPMLSTGPAKPGAKPRDSRISYSYSHKYKNGQLTEMQMYHNDGVPGMRYTYTYNVNIMENLVYDEEGKLNQKYVYTLDDKGNQIFETNVDVFPSQMYGDRKYKTTYDSFDEKGNWTKKTKSKLVVENGKEVFTPSYISFRTITYFK